MSRRSSKRRVQVSDDDEIEEATPAKRGRVASVDEDEEEANGAAKRRILSKGKGRAVEPETESEADEIEEEGEEANGHQEAEPVLFRPELERGDDGYVSFLLQR